MSVPSGVDIPILLICYSFVDDMVGDCAKVCGTAAISNGGSIGGVMVGGYMSGRKTSATGSV